MHVAPAYDTEVHWLVLLRIHILNIHSQVYTCKDICPLPVIYNELQFTITVNAVIGFDLVMYSIFPITRNIWDYTFVGNVRVWVSVMVFMVYYGIEMIL